jgi:hypothetical protein
MKFFQIIFFKRNLKNTKSTNQHQIYTILTRRTIFNDF